MADPTKQTLAIVVKRDRGLCAKCANPIQGRRGFDWSLHHRRPRGAGGSKVAWVNLPANLLLLHGSGVTGCHGDVESRREDSYREGFLVSLNGFRTACQVPILHAVHGWVVLDDAGGHSGYGVIY